MDEVTALFHDQIVPAVKKSGATDYGVAVARFGTPMNEIHSYIGMSGWGDLEHRVDHLEVPAGPKLHPASQIVG